LDLAEAGREQNENQEDSVDSNQMIDKNCAFRRN
jgi:hypothetical protein